MGIRHQHFCADCDELYAPACFCLERDEDRKRERNLCPSCSKKQVESTEERRERMPR